MDENYKDDCDKKDDYSKYVYHQMGKTLNSEKRKKWLGIEWRQKIGEFNIAFEQHKDILLKCKRALCIGARTGQEVVSLSNFIKDSIGIDLVECQPYVLKGDAHNLDFDNKSFDFVYSNIFDHILYKHKFFKEIHRVLKKEGYALFHFGVGIGLDDYGVNEIKNINLDVFPFLQNFKIIKNDRLKINLFCNNWELLLQKE